MRKSHLLIFLITAAILYLCFVLVEDASCKSARFVRFSEVSTVSQVKEQTLDVAVMIFTEDEAKALMERFEAEREAERQAKLKAEREAAARRVASATYSPAYFKRAGRISWGGWSWTYYSEKILPGYGLRIPGRHTDSLGYVRDGNGYLCLASDVLRKGTVIETPFGGYGKVYDCGCGNNYTVDVYVGW